MLNQFAAGFARSHARFVTPDGLEVTGVLCGHVATVGKSVFSCRNVAQCLETIRSWEPEDLYQRKYITGEDYVSAYLHVLRHGSFKDHFREGSPPTFEVWKREATKAGFINNGVKEMTDSGLERIWLDCFQVLQKRSFITTKEGYIGIAPKTVRTGDLIVVILGTDQPMILRLRPNSSPSPSYTLLGVPTSTVSKTQPPS